MTVDCKTIPLEIWINVLKYVEMPSDICQCRLVCKRWDYIAETALFTKELRVNDIQTASKMYNHLIKQPKRAHLIRYLDFRNVRGDEPETLLLLREAFTTSMKFLAEEMEEMEETPSLHLKFFVTLVDIVESAPPHSCFSLQIMPYCYSSEPYAKAAYTFRNTLQNLKTTFDSSYMRSMFDKLAVFKQLRYLELDGDTVTTLEDLESTLRHCDKLKVLHLYINVNAFPHQTTAAITEWTKAHVQQVESLTDLDTSACETGAIQYLAYKYPNLSYFRCAASYFYDDEEFFRLMSVAKNTKQFFVVVTIAFPDKVEQLLQDVCRLDDKSLVLSVGIAGPSEIEDVRGQNAEVELTMYNMPNQQRRGIDLEIDFEHVTFVEYLDLLDQLSRCNISRLNLNTLSRRSFERTEPTATEEESMLDIIDVINRFSTVSRVTLSMDEIPYTPSRLDNRASWKVDTLEIYDTKIDSRALEQISQCSPHLKNITLQNCSIVNEEQAQQDLFDVNMPHSTLSTITIRTNVLSSLLQWSNPEYCEALINKVSATETCYVHIALPLIEKHIYLICSPLVNTVVPFKLYEELQHRQASLNIKITVADLKQLRIRLGPVRTVFNLYKYLDGDVKDDQVHILVECLGLPMDECQVAILLQRAMILILNAGVNVEMCKDDGPTCP
ncbi:hypothetical protein MBANPS3_008374 [Mucor bainieri]